MKKKVKLAFDMLEKEMEVISRDEQIQFLGGNGGATGYNDPFYKVENGQPYVSYDGVTWTPSLSMVSVYGGSNIGGAQVQQDPDGTSYYLDNAGRVHYLMDSSILWDGIKGVFTDVTSYLGAAWEFIRGQGALGAGSAAGPLISVEGTVVKEWYNLYGNKTGYMGAGGVWYPLNGSTGSGN